MLTTAARCPIPRAVCCGAIAGVLFLWTAISAQEQQPPRFRSGTQSVEVDVRVFDRQGRFIGDLEAADFSITENGVPQVITSLVLVSRQWNRPRVAVRPDASAPAVSERETWIFVFDSGHMRPGGFGRARDAVARFLEDGFPTDGVGGILAGGRMAGNRLTTDRTELQRAVRALTPSGELTALINEMQRWPRILDEEEARRVAGYDRQALDAAIQRACDDDPVECAARKKVDVPIDLIVAEKATRIAREAERMSTNTLTTLDRLCTQLAALPGPKTIVMFSDGFMIERLGGQLQTIAGQAARVGARFYTIDSGGLGGTSDGLNAEHSSSSGEAMRAMARTDLMNGLALDTGGLAIRNINDLSKALARVSDDTGLYYVLSYSPAQAAFDGSFRKIGVTVNRPGIEVRARRGYLALEPTPILRPDASLAPRHAGPVEPPRVPALPVRPFTDRMVAANAVMVGPSWSGDPGNPVATRGTRGERLKQLAAREPAGAPRSRLASDGWAAYERGDLSTARTLLGQAAAEPDVRPWVLYALGFAHIASGAPDDAAAVWERVRQRAPEFKPVYFDLADAHLRRQDEASALAALRAAERLWPADSEVHNAIGVVQFRRGALDDALASFNRAIASAPDEALGYFNAGRVHQMRYLKTHRYNSNLQRWVGNEQDLRAAERCFQKYVELDGPYAQQARDALASLTWKR